jgi:hypothetical protein
MELSVKSNSYDFFSSDFLKFDYLFVHFNLNSKLSWLWVITRKLLFLHFLNSNAYESYYLIFYDQKSYSTFLHKYLKLFFHIKVEQV